MGCVRDHCQTEAQCHLPQNREFQIIVITFFSGNMVQYLWAPSSLFSWSWLSTKTPVSQHPLSSWTNTTAYSIPGAQTLLLCGLSFQEGMLISFALTWWEMRTICCSTLLTAVLFSQCGRGGCICSASPGKKEKRRSEQGDPHRFLSLETGRSYSRCSLSFKPRVDVYRSARCSVDTGGYTQL